jgi:hypothetical protein
VRRLIEAGELKGERLSGSTHWKLSLQSVLDFEQRRAAREQRADEFSHSLDEMGAPAE